MESLINKTISINGGHDCSACFIDKEGKLRVFEFERFIKKRYAIFSSTYEQRPGYGTTEEEKKSFLDFVKQNTKEKPELILWHEMNARDLQLLRESFPDAKFEYSNHHESHAYGSIHQSKLDDCLVFSIDAGGMDKGQMSTVNVFLFEKNKLKNIYKKNIDFGLAYNYSSKLLSEIPEKVPGDLSVAGRLMGLTAYGEIINEWVEPFEEFFRCAHLHELCNKIGIPCIEDNCLSGQTSYNFARTAQHAFENELFRFVKPFLNKYKKNIIMTGGCALNVLFNQKLYEYVRDQGLEIYVSPNPNDCGLSHGMFVQKFFNLLPRQEIYFNGIHIIDESDLGMYKNPYDPFSIQKIVKHLADGKILGIINGNSEVGPRALGNRSIICYPAFEDMKDVLNSKVKFREWFRPFAPVCKLENKDTFFENARESKYMSFAPTVKKEYRKKLASITHVDNTARLQTVEHGHFFYDVLSEMEKQDLIPVILNTSFNIKGYPILTTLEDAFFALNNTQMDFLVYKDRIYSK